MAASAATAATRASRKTVAARTAVWCGAFMVVGIILCGVGASQMSTTCPATCQQRSCVAVSYKTYACDCGGYCTEGTKTPGAVMVIGIVLIVLTFIGLAVAGFKWIVIMREEQAEAGKKESTAAKVQFPMSYGSPQAQQIPMTTYPMTQIGQHVSAYPTAYPVQAGIAYPSQQAGVAYPAAQQAGVAYPSQQTAGAYPSQQAGVAYPAVQQAGVAYPSQQAGVAYPSQQAAGGAYPAQQAGGAYPAAQQAVVYPSQQAGQMMIVDINGVPTMVSLAAPPPASTVAATSPAAVATAIPAEGPTNNM